MNSQIAEKKLGRNLSEKIDDNQDINDEEMAKIINQKS